MPGIIQAQVSVAVLPQFLCEAFVQEREYLANVNEYKDATAQRELLLFNSRRRWTIRSKSAVSVTASLRNFWLARKGPTHPFYFYDYSESTPKGNYDATGVSTNGRFLVRFAGSWNQQQNVGQLGTADFQLVELIEGLSAAESAVNWESIPSSGWLVYF